MAVQGEAAGTQTHSKVTRGKKVVGFPKYPLDEDDRILQEVRESQV